MEKPKRLLIGDDEPEQIELLENYAVADVFDALTGERLYKKAFTKEDTFEIIWEGRETHFHLRIADVFLNAKDRFRGFGKKFSFRRVVREGIMDDWI